MAVGGEDLDPSSWQLLQYMPPTRRPRSLITELDNPLQSLNEEEDLENVLHRI